VFCVINCETFQIAAVKMPGTMSVFILLVSRNSITVFKVYICFHYFYWLILREGWFNIFNGWDDCVSAIEQCLW